MLPSSAGTWLVCTYLFRSLISVSRWSSRSLGGWPEPVARAICWFTAAMRVTRPFTEVTLSFSFCWVVDCSSSICEAAVLKRPAISLARVSTTERAVRSVGAADTSVNAFSMSVTEAPRPVAPPGNTSSSCSRLAERAESEAATELARVACLVRNWSLLRLMVATDTPRPMKPAPLYWPPADSRCTVCLL